MAIHVPHLVAFVHSCSYRDPHSKSPSPHRLLRSPFSQLLYSHSYLSNMDYILFCHIRSAKCYAFRNHDAYPRVLGLARFERLVCRGIRRYPVVLLISCKGSGVGHGIGKVCVDCRGSLTSNQTRVESNRTDHASSLRFQHEIL